ALGPHLDAPKEMAVEGVAGGVLGNDQFRTMDRGKHRIGIPAASDAVVVVRSQRSRCLDARNRPGEALAGRRVPVGGPTSDPSRRWRSFRVRITRGPGTG